MPANIGVERAIIASVCQFGKDALIDLEDLGVMPESFTQPSNQALFTCLKNVLVRHTEIDQPILLIAIKDAGYDTLFNGRRDIEYLNSLFTFPIVKSNIRPLAIKLERLAVARKAIRQHRRAIESLEGISGNESIDDIIAMSENPIFDIILELSRGKNQGPHILFEEIEEYIEFLRTHKQEQMGIPTPWKQYNAGIGGGLRNGGVNLIAARPKIGKMQPNTCLVYTPNGPKQLGDLQSGDLVCDPYGNTSKVKQIFEHHNKPVYKVTFTDGDSTICGLEHLWRVKKNRRSTKYNIMSLDDILTNGLYDGDRHKWHIQTTEPVYFDKKKLLLDPYIMGLLLGDGSFRNTVALTSVDKEIISTFTQYIESFNGYKIRQSKITYFPTHGCKGKTNIFKEKIRHYNLLNKSSHDKFIPTDYLYSSIDDRWELLRGLLDTDGHATKHAIEYTTVSQQLSIDVKKLVQSLGGLCSIKQRTTKCNNKKYESYRLYIRFPNNKLAFKLKRKINSAAIRSKPLTRKIKSVEYLRQENCRCISLDNSNKLYLTDHYIVTHNTTLGKELLLHCTNTLNIPVLFLDTEMSKENQVIRSVASISGVPLLNIETGKFDNNIVDQENINRAVRQLKQNKLLYYESIAGKSFDEVLAIIRRWIVKHVGYDDNGNTNKCVVVYDYFKLMDKSHLENLREYEAMGYQISKLTDFTKEYDFPCLAFVQLNRQEEVSQSDRLVWICHSFSKFKTKDDAERADDGENGGNRKLEICQTRFGGGLDERDYICLNFERAINRITEIGLASEIRNNGQNNHLEFQTTGSVIGDEIL